MSCARLPLALALAIIAARAAARPGFPLAHIAAELRQAAALLDPFDGGELAVNVRTVFACSYHALSAGAARLFRLLGLHPGPDISASAAASLAGVARDQATALLATITRTPSGFDAYTWRLASAVTTFLDRRGYWQDLKAAQGAALAAARRQGDHAGQATACRGLGLAYRGLKQFDDARTHYLLALDLFRELGHLTGQAQTHVNLAWLAGAQGRHREALEHSRQSLRHYQATGSREGQASALNNVGWHFAELGGYDQALAYCRKALALVCELGDLSTQAHTWDSLGYIYLHLDRHQQAVECYQHAILLFSATGDLYGEATSLSRLGDVHDAVGAGSAARRAWMRALDIFGRLGYPDASKMRAKLRSRAHERPAATALLSSSVQA